MARKLYNQCQQIRVFDFFAEHKFVEIKVNAISNLRTWLHKEASDVFKMHIYDGLCYQYTYVL